MYNVRIAAALFVILCITTSHGLKNSNLHSNVNKSTADKFRDNSQTNYTHGATLDSQPPPSWHSPFNWTSVSMTHIGSSDLREAATFSYTIPDHIPSTAKEVLVYVTVDNGDSSVGVVNHLKIYTQIGDSRYEKYIFIKTWNQNAINTNSDNMWLPMPPNHLVYLTITAVEGVNTGVNLYTIGYR